jgi:hypothetical protein
VPPVPDHATLLRKHSPVLRFSLLESYRPDAVEVMTEPFDDPRASQNWLKRNDGSVIAATDPTGNQAQLSAGFLAASRYANNQQVRGSDYLDIGARDYVEAAGIRHANAGFSNRAYGRVVTDAGGTWLQYWFFYFYNSKAFVVGEHEGDWEMMQVRIGDDGKPVEATYSQHSFAEQRPWSRVRRAGAKPIVYVAVASHACYFEPGRYRFQRFFHDQAFGDGEQVTPTLVDITSGTPSWVGWPGRWGSTSSLIGGIGASPSSPCKQTQKWERPSAFNADAVVRPVAAPAMLGPVPAPPVPKISVRRTRDGVSVRYTIAAPKGPETEPVLLVVSIDAGVEGVPPATYSFPLEAMRGTVRPPTELDDRAYVVRAVTVDGTGMLSAAATAELPKKVKAKRRS